MNYPACKSDVCGQNPKNCPTREACHVPVDDDLESWAGLFIIAIVFVAALAAALWPI